MKPLEQTDQIYVMYSACTSMPYVYQQPDTAYDLLLVFDKKENYDACAGQFAEEKRPVRCVECKKAQYTQFFTGMYYIGVDGVLLNMGGEEKTFSLSELAKKPDYASMPSRMMQLQNARLQLPMLYFLQEVRRPVPAEQKRGLAAMEEEVMTNLAKTSFLIPYKMIQNGSQSQDPSRRQVEMLTIRDKEGNLFQPLFTDAMEFVKYSQQKQLECLIVPFWDLDKFMYSRLKGYMINPLGCNLLMERPQYEHVKKNFSPGGSGARGNA